MSSQDRGSHKGFGEQVGKTLDSAIDRTVDTAEELADSLLHLRLPRLSRSKPGAVPGIDPDSDHLAAVSPPPADAGPVCMTCIDYSVDRVEVREIDDIPGFLSTHREPWVHVRWINVIGLHDIDTLRQIGRKYRLHPLAIEDMVHVPQRPKLEAFDPDGKHAARLFVVLQMMQLLNGRLDMEQVSLFLGHNTVLTFQQRVGDVWRPIRERIATDRSRLRQNDASFLLYALLDAVVDHCYPIVESYGDRLEQLEVEVLDHPTVATIQHLHTIKREFLLLRRQLWPVRELISSMLREPHPCLSATTLTYLRDVLDHSIHVLDILETYREIASGMIEAYMSSVSNRTNQVMKVLTIIACLFIPITFIAGVFGMNFEQMPWLEEPYGFLLFCGLCVATVGTMLIWFRRHDWI